MREIVLTKKNAALKKIGRYKYLSSITKYLFKLNPHQEKKISNLFATQQIDYFKFSNQVCNLVVRLEKFWKIKKYFSVLAYNDFCNETMREQFYLKKYGTYKAIKENIDNKLLYSSSNKMKKYLLGLLLTQIFWKSHYKIIKWFNKSIKNKRIISFLEVGSGHGLMTKH